MMDSFDVLLVDLQDLGCRIYTFITTLRYVLEAAAKHGKSVWVLDRPNPAGRPVEGLTLRDGWESFVGAGPMPMRHGLTMGELGHWFIATLARRRLPRDHDAGLAARRRARLRLAARRTHLDQPQPERPQPVDGPRLRRHRDARRHDAVRRARHDAAAGTVRRAGHRRPRRARRNARASPRTGWPAACCANAGSSRPSTSTPASCATACRSTSKTPATTTPPSALAPAGAGLQGDPPLSPDYPLWRDFAYEYEHDRLAIDLINGSPLLREWVDLIY
jgi:hypothetical protein